jgi:uncharacterized protein
VTLVDAGPMIALLNRTDFGHSACSKALTVARRPLMTTWACLTEALYLVGKEGGYEVQDDLLGMFDDGLFELHVGSQFERARIRVLMAQYRDTPMDFADASLVAAAETLGTARIFTLDRHFYACRIDVNRPFEVIP